MSSSAVPKPQPHATAVEFSGHEMIVSLTDGRRLSVPLEWFPRLRDASPEQRAAWRLIGSGIGIACDELDAPTPHANPRRGARLKLLLMWV